jgi:translation initiation factor IF-3
VKSKNSTRMKEVKFRVGTGQHDYNIKMGRAEGFLDTGHKVRMVLQFRGRENAHKELGFVMMKRIIEDLKQIAHVDQEPRLNGRAVGMTLSPLPQHQRKRRFHLFHGELMEEDDFEDDEEGEGFDEDITNDDTAEVKSEAEQTSEAAMPSEELAAEKE